MRSSKLHEPQPYLEPNSPRSKMAARGLIPPGEASSISVVTVVEAATDPLEISADRSDQVEQKRASDEGENGCSAESNPSSDHEAPATEEQSGAASSSSTLAKSLEAGEQPDIRVVVTEAADHHDDQERSDGGAKSESEPRDKEQNGTETQGTAGGGRGVGEEEEVKVKVKPAPGSLYADLGDFEPVNLLSFAYQIASGMVSKRTQCHNCL